MKVQNAAAAAFPSWPEAAGNGDGPFREFKA